ncbi:hypothetical protein GBA52_015374 [Prunus armeniaca]|nr:hypothetical protein GBA52_015374 [Prunus armeniaca]
MKETTEVQSEEKHMNDGLPKTVKEQMLDELLADKERMQGQLNELITSRIDEAQTILYKLYLNEKERDGTKERKRLKKERWSELYKEYKEHEGGTDQWKEEGKYDLTVRDETLRDNGVHDTTTALKNKNELTKEQLQAIKDEVKAKQPKLYDHKPSKKKNKGKPWKGKKPKGFGK